MEVKSKTRIVGNVKPTRRKRTRPVRKWRNSEINHLINYLLENREFEKPSQRVYYLDFIRQYGVDIPWDLIKGKVRNLRTKYEKLRDLYLASDHVENRDKNVKIVESHRPHFDKLAIIFGNLTKIPLTNIKDETSWETDVSTSQQSNFVEQKTDVAKSMDDEDINQSFNIKEVRFGQDAKLAEFALTSSHPTSEITEKFSNPIQESIPLPAIVKDELLWETDVSVPLNQTMDQHSVITTSIDSADIINSFNMTEVSYGQDNKMVASPTPEHDQIVGLAENPLPVPLTDTNIRQDLETLKFEFQKEKFLRRMALKEKKFEFKMESVRKKFKLKTVELELEKMKIEKDLHLGKIRLEVNERVTLKKLEMRQNEGEAEV